MKRKGKIKVVIFSILLIIVCIITYLMLPYSPVKNEYWKSVNELIKRTDLSKGKITKEDLIQLPEPIQKYFIKNGYVGIGRASTVIFEFKNADFALGLNKPKVKIDYTAYDFVDEPDRLALIDSKLYGIPFQGIDSYVNGKGSMKGVIGKNITLFNVKGKGMDSGELITYLSESLMHPSLAIEKRITYKTIDEYSVEATIVDKGIEASGIFHFNEKYEMTSFEAVRFAVDTQSYEKWSAIAADYKEINGINVPTKFQAVWHYNNSVDLMYFDSNGMKISYR